MMLVSPAEYQRLSESRAFLPRLAAPFSNGSTSLIPLKFRRSLTWITRMELPYVIAFNAVLCHSL